MYLTTLQVYDYWLNYIYTRLLPRCKTTEGHVPDYPQVYDYWLHDLYLTHPQVYDYWLNDMYLTTLQVYDYWLNDMYLANRMALPINSSPVMVFPPQHFRAPIDSLRYQLHVCECVLSFCMYNMVIRHCDIDKSRVICVKRLPMLRRCKIIWHFAVWCVSIAWRLSWTLPWLIVAILIRHRGGGCEGGG